MCHFTPIITTITIGELVYGAYKSDCLEFFIEKLENIMILNMRILSFDEGAAEVYGKLWRSSKKMEHFSSVSYLT